MLFPIPVSLFYRYFCSYCILLRDRAPLVIHLSLYCVLITKKMVCFASTLSLHVFSLGLIWPWYIYPFGLYYLDKDFLGSAHCWRPRCMTGWCGWLLCSSVRFLTLCVPFLVDGALVYCMLRPMTRCVALDEIWRWHTGVYLFGLNCGLSICAITPLTTGGRFFYIPA